MKKLDVSLHAVEPLRAGLLRVADGLIQNALDPIRYPTSDRGEDVHLVRVTIKRLRAMLRLIRPVISKAVFDREYLRLKRAARRFSLVRDTDVARQTLASLQVSKGRERDAVAGMLSGFDGDGELQVEISKATNRVELDLERMESALQAARLVF